MTAPSTSHSDQPDHRIRPCSGRGDGRRATQDVPGFLPTAGAGGRRERGKREPAEIRSGRRRMTRVGILKNWDWPDLMRQTPGGNGIWADCRFAIDPQEQCDYVIVLNEWHFKRLISSYLDYYHLWRIHQSHNQTACGSLIQRRLEERHGEKENR